jgi:SAM-dependent methyltransferase
MHSNTVQRQYDEVIAPHYDRDPLGVVGRSLDRGVEQILRHAVPADGPGLKVLDLGVGTGQFLARLKRQGIDLQPFGIDLSEKMVDIARERIPDLVGAVDDATNVEAHFGGESFDLISTHFITGFVPISVLAPKVRGRLAEGGHWSFVGGTKAGFPTLQTKANGRAMKFLFGGRSVGVDDLVCNPADGAEVVAALENNGFAVVECETFAPALAFKNLDEFLDFGYYGGWLTPFIEPLGLHEARPMVRRFLNAFFFPVQDHHSIEIVLAQKRGA